MTEGGATKNTKFTKKFSHRVTENTEIFGTAKLPVSSFILRSPSSALSNPCASVANSNRPFVAFVTSWSSCLPWQTRYLFTLPGKTKGAHWFRLLVGGAGGRSRTIRWPRKKSGQKSNANTDLALAA